MAGKRNYGDRTLTREVKSTGTKPIYLVDASVGQCYCAECQKTFKSDKLAEVCGSKSRWEIERMLNSNRNSKTRTISSTAEFTEDDITCPECHQKGEYAFTDGSGRMFNSRERAEEEKHIDFTHAKYINDTISGRYVYESRNNGKLTKIEDNVMTENATIFPTGKTFHERKEISITYDLEKKQIQNATTYIHNGQRIPGPIVDSIDPFMNNPKFKRTERRLSSGGKDNYGMHKYVFSTMTTPDREDSRNLETKRNMLFETTTSSNEWRYVDDERYDEINDHIIRTLAGSIEHKDPLFADPFATKLFLKEHKQDSTRENTPENNSIKYYYATLAVKYPGVLQYIEESAMHEIEDRKYAMQRKAQEDPTYQVSEIPDSAKAKIYREHFTKIASQLEAIDDKITASLSKCKTAEEVVEVCHGFAFGAKEFKGNSGTKPFALRNVDDKVFDEKSAGTKKQYQAFKKNPLGMANTIYTLRKMKITDENHIKKVLEITGDEGGCKNRNKADKKRHYENFMTDFNTIAPIRSREMMSYFSCFAQSKDINSVIDDLYGDKDDLQHWQMFIFDGINGYKNLMESKVGFNKLGKNKIHEDASEDKNQSVRMKTAMRTYFENGFSIKDAYIAYADVFGNDTYETVNSYARVIKEENKILNMSGDYDTYAENNHISSYYGQDELLKYMSDKYPEIKTQEDIDNMINTADNIAAETTIIDTRNGKPLFHRRNVQEIHDEISNMMKNIPKTNETLVFKHGEEALEGEFSGETELKENDPPKTPEQIEEESHNKLKFELLRDRFSYIRTSSVLYNCLMSCDYFSKTKRDACVIYVAKDENKQTVGCIELTRNRDGDGYKLQQFQTVHDAAMPERFRTAAVKWFEANNIQYENCHDYHRWGDGHVNESLDYHHEEMDEAYGIPVATNELKARQAKRKAAAVEIYGLDENGQINVPEAPEDLAEFV